MTAGGMETRNGIGRRERRNDRLRRSRRNAEHGFGHGGHRGGAAAGTRKAGREAIMDTVDRSARISPVLGRANRRGCGISRAAETAEGEQDHLQGDRIGRPQRYDLACLVP
jgi:hypothetical protein